MATVFGNGSILQVSVDSNEKKTVQVKNNSTTMTFTDVQVKFTFPASLGYSNTSPAPPQGAYDIGTSTWVIGNMLAGQVLNWDIEVEVIDSLQKPLTFSYKVTSAEHPDQMPGNDESSRTFDAVISCEDFDNCATVNELHGAVLYVSTSGANNTALRSSEHQTYRDPWAAAADAQDGDTIYVYPGTYTIGDSASGEDVEFIGTTDSVNLIPTGLSKISYHFENGVTLQSLATPDGAPEPFYLFNDRDTPVEVNITGHLHWETRERFTHFAHIENAGSIFRADLYKITHANDAVDTTTSDIAGAFILDMNASHSRISVKEVRGSVLRFGQFFLDDLEGKLSVDIDSLILEETDIDTVNQTFFVLAGTQLQGQASLKIRQSQILIDNATSAANQGAISLFDFDTITDALNFHLTFDIQDHYDNIGVTSQLTSGLQTNNPLIRLASMPNTVTKSHMNFILGAIQTGSHLIDAQMPNKVFVDSFVTLKADSIQLNTLGMLVVTGIHTSTMTRSQFALNFGNSMRTMDPLPVNAPMIAFNNNNKGVSRNESKIIISGVFTAQDTEPIINFNDLGDPAQDAGRYYLWKDCTFLIGTPTSPVAVATTVVDMVIQNCVTNSTSADADVVEKGQPIYRDLSYL